MPPAALAQLSAWHRSWNSLGIRWVTPGSHLVPAVSNGPFPCVFRDQVSKYPANLQRGMENVALRKKRTKKRRKGGNQKSSDIFCLQDTMFLAPLGPVHAACREWLSQLCWAPWNPISRSSSMPAGQPGHLQSKVSLWNIFSWKDLEAARGLWATIPSHSQHFLGSVWNRVQHPWVTEQLMWPQSEPLTQSQFEPCTHWLRESSYWSVINPKLEPAVTQESTFLVFVVQTHLGVNPYTRV